MTPARFRWGLFLILLGVLFLLRNFDVLNDNFWIDLLILFPVVLIAVGVEKIFARTKLRVISYLTSVALLFGGLLIAFAGSHGGEDTSFFSRTTYVVEEEPTVQFMRAELDVDETDLTIRDSGRDLIYARFNELTRKPKIDYETRDGEAFFKLASRQGSFLGGAVQIKTGDDQDWFLRFSQDIPLEMTCSGYKSDLHLNMSTTRLRQIDVDADKAKVYLKLGDFEPVVKVSVFGEDAEVRLRVPESVQLKVFGRDYSSYLKAIGLIEGDDAFVHPGPDSVENVIEVRLDDRLGSLSIDFF